MNAHWKSLLLLCTVFVVIMAYAMLPTGIGVGNIKLKKAEFPFLSNLATDKPYEAAVADTTSVNEVKTDSIGQTILFFGDSMLEGLGKRLADYAEQNGHKLHIVLWYSSTSQQWAETNTLNHFIGVYNPTYIVVCLGSNEMFVKDLADRDKNIKQILAKMGNIPYVWIGPPNWKKDTGIDSLILKNVGRKRYFDSQRLTFQRGSDNVHPTMTSASAWMDSVATWMQSKETAHPILMKHPERKGKAESMKLLQPDFRGL